MNNMGRIVVLLMFGAIGAHAQLSIDLPAGGEIFYTNRDTVIDIRWSGVEDTINVRLEYSTDGNLWKLIADSVTGLQYQWIISGLPVSSSYRVRVLQSRPPQAADNVIYTGHQSPVADAYWSPSGDRIVSVAMEPHIWDANVGGTLPLVALPSPAAGFSSVRWRSDSAKILTASDDGVARIYETQQNSLELSFIHPVPVEFADFNSTNELILTSAADNRVRLFRPPGTASVDTLNPASAIEHVAFSPNGSRILICANQAKVYSVSGGLPLSFTRHTSGVLWGAWSPDGTLIATVGGDATVRLWDAVTGVQKWANSDPREGVRSVAFSHNGAWVAVAMSDSTVTMWDVQSGQLVKTFGGHTATVRIVEFSPDDRLLLSASDDNSALVHDVSTGFRRRFLHLGDVLTARWSPDGTRFVSTSQDTRAIVWRILNVTLQADTSALFSIAQPPPAFAQFVASGDTLDIGSETTIYVSLEGATELDLADIDSVAFTMQYDATMLHLLSTSIPFASQSSTSGVGTVIFKPIPMPQTDSPLFDVRFRATLGADSVSAFSFNDVRQIGNGPGIQVTTRSEPILVRGICRATGTPRLYIPVGTILEIIEQPSPDASSVTINLAESGTTSLTLYSLNGEVLWTDVAGVSEIQQRVIVRQLPHSLTGTYAILVVGTPTQTISKVIGLIRR